MAFDFSPRAYNQYNQLAVEMKTPIRDVMKALKKLAGAGYNKNTDFYSAEILELYRMDLFGLSYKISDAPDLIEEIESVQKVYYTGARAVKEPISNKYDDGKCTYTELEFVIQIRMASLEVNPFTIVSVQHSMQHFVKLYRHKMDDIMTSNILNSMKKAMITVDEVLSQVGLSSRDLTGQHMDGNRLERVGLGWYKILMSKLETEEERAYWFDRVLKYSKENYDNPKLNELNRLVIDKMNL